MRRREFIALVGGAAATWPVAARAQQPTLPVIGFLRSTSLVASDHIVGAFREGLKETGFVEGENARIEYHSAEDSVEKLAALVAELIGRRVAVIVGNIDSALAAKAATNPVPIVFGIGSDPVKFGLVATYNRPGGNITGVTFFGGMLGAKRLELMRELVPASTRIAVLLSRGPESEAERPDLHRAAQTVGSELIVLDASSDHDIETAFATFVERQAGALICGAGAFLNSRRERLVALAARHALPASYALPEFVTAGGLMSYGASITDAYRQVGTLVGRILKGEKPSDLPVLQSSKVELVINLKTAKALGITIPPSVLARADKVIE
jgi:putative ABC transport system substrate-binding protein